MPSRKRAKGKERKLKQQARQSVSSSSSSPPPAVGGDISLPEQNIQRIEQVKNIKCLHGGFLPPQEHPVNDFFNTLQEVCNLEDCSILMTSAMLKTFEKHEDVWNDSTSREMVINYMLGVGTDFLLDDDYIEGARKNSQGIIILEKFTSEGDYQSAVSKATEDYCYMLNAEERDVVRFYYKRIPCSCLDKLYSKIKKSQDRGSLCFHCKKTCKHKDIKVCSRCKCTLYCSKECQISDWPTHKEFCKGLGAIHEGM